MSLNVDVLIRDIEIAFTRLSSSKDASVSSKFTDNPPKSTAKAQSLIKTAKEFFKEQKVEDALTSYTKSIAYARDVSEELGIAYSIRAAALFIWRRRLRQSCTSWLLDINRALKNHCSDVLRQNIVLDIKQKFLTLMKSADGSGDTGDEIDEDATNPPADREPSWRTDIFSQFGNPFIPNASPKIKLEYDEKWGRHFVATADIQPGETLLIEDYFVTLVFSDDDGRYKYCDFCISPCNSLIPCDSCVKVMYCSTECRQNAYDSYHRLECKLSIFFPSYNSAAVEIAIRMFLIGTKQGASLENLMNTLSTTDVFAENFNFSGKPVDSDYLTALRLTHGAFNQSRLESLVEKAVEFVIVLQKYAFFESVPADRLEKAKIFTVLLLLNNCSDRCINVLQNSDSRKSGEVLQIGAGLCPLQYMFNHSCFPNVGTHRRKREFIVFTTRPIKKDEQLFVTYYNEFQSTPKAERAENLNFKCQCEACLNNWPTTTELGSSASMAMSKQIKDFLEYCDRCEAGRVLISSVMRTVVPLLDDTSLLNLRVDKVVRILSEMMSLCCQVMSSRSFIALVQTRYCLLKFIRYYYEEMERDPTQDRNLKFPDVENLRRVVNISIGCTKPTEMFFIQAVKTIFVALLRLLTYIRQSRFIRKK